MVQVKIYEVIDDKTKHYATLYQDDFYDEDGKMIIVSDPSFPDSYSNSLIEISDELGVSSSEFNTNKNWKIEFIYDLVENYVNIQYRKYNEDESKQAPIYIFFHTLFVHSTYYITPYFLLLVPQATSLAPHTPFSLCPCYTLQIYSLSS